MVKKSKEKQVIAWQGWTIPVREEWQPVRIEGDFYRGRMIVGNGDGPVFQVSWQRPKDIRDFDCAKWLSKQKSKYTDSQVGAVNTGDDNDIEITSLDGDIKNGRNMEHKQVWWVYSASIGIVMEISMPDVAVKEEQEFVRKHSVPEVRFSRPNEPSWWQIYKVGFSVPAGYILNEKHIFSGDIALEFRNEKEDRLLVRQIYPAELGLARRKIDKWLLVCNPFKEHRKFRKQDEGDFYCGKLQGMYKEGMHNIKFPLGWIKPLHYRKVAAVDKDLDRLLIAGQMSPDKIDPTLLEGVVTSMNDGVF